MGGCCCKDSPGAPQRRRRRSDMERRRRRRGRSAHGYQEQNDGEEAIPAPRSERARRGRVLRVASWNLQCFSLDKANNSSVLEAVCLIILNKRLDLIALQELASPDALEKIRDELNDPQLKGVKTCKRWRQGEWRFVASTSTGRMHQCNEYSGFLWHSSTGVQLLNCGLLGGDPRPGENKFTQRPFIGYFKTDHWKFVLVSVHLKETSVDMSDLQQLKVEVSMLLSLTQAIEAQGHRKIILLGDFNMDAYDQSFSRLRGAGFTNLIPVTIPTNISGNNPRGTKQFDNIWISDAMYEWKLHGRWGVVREGLAHRSMPISSLESRGGGTISDHCPIWADFKV